MGSLTKSHLCFLVTFLFAIHVLHYISPLEANNNGGFSARLIRKNLPSRRSIFQPNIYNGGESPVNAYLGQYLMEVSIGTPPVTIQGIADTGSDLVWTQCVPCDNCYKQQKPLFNSQKSSTYSNIACTSQLCHKLDTGVCSPQKQCNYSYGYGDSSLTKGVLAQETLTLEQNRKVSGFIFGCGHNDKGGFNDHEMGIIGLGRGEVSLISQIGFNFGGKLFSMCLVPFGTDPSISSEIRFGSGSEVIGHGVDSTPLVFKEGDKTTYSVTLNDSGTPPTVLPQDLYDRLVAEVRNQVKMEPIKDDPQLGADETGFYAHSSVSHLVPLKLHHIDFFTQVTIEVLWNPMRVMPFGGCCKDQVFHRMRAEYSSFIVVLLRLEQLCLAHVESVEEGVGADQWWSLVQTREW
ncbi:Aspartic proteinase [Arachis hypogaea]|nr:Aspartic proteinase [Arachis hypogaea]